MIVQVEKNAAVRSRGKSRHPAGIPVSHYWPKRHRPAKSQPALKGSLGSGADALEAGCYAFMAKPLRPSELVSLVRLLLANHAVRDRNSAPLRAV